MLDLAIKHVDQLQDKMLSTWFDDKYKYFHCSNWYSNEKIVKNDTWNQHQFVSVNTAGEVIGFISYEIKRAENYACALAAINFSDQKMTFGKDLGQCIQEIFEKFKFEKLKFSVVVGNPIERTYDTLIEKYGGRVVGTFQKDVKLIDGEYYDFKLYELTRENYLKNTKI